MKVLDAAQAAAALPFERLIPALREAFVSGAEVPLRHRHDIAQPDGTTASLLLMPAWRENGLLGVKVVSVFPGNGARGLPAVSAELSAVRWRHGRTSCADRWRRDHPAPHRRSIRARRVFSCPGECHDPADRRLRPCRRTDGRGVSCRTTNRTRDGLEHPPGRCRASCGEARGRGGDRSGRGGTAGRYSFVCNFVA